MEAFKERICEITNEILKDENLTNLQLKEIAMAYRKQLNQLEKKLLDGAKSKNAKLEPLHLNKTASQEFPYQTIIEQIQFSTPQGNVNVDYPSTTQFTEVDNQEEDDELDHILKSKIKEHGGFFCKEDILSARPTSLSRNLPKNLIEEYIPEELLPIFPICSQKIIQYSQFSYAPSIDISTYNPLMENGTEEIVESGEGIYYSGELDIFGQPQNRGFWLQESEKVQQFYIGEFFNGAFHGQGLMLTVSDFSWIFEQEDFYGFSLEELEIRKQSKAETQGKKDLYFYVFEGEWRDGDIVKGKVECYKNIEELNIFKQAGLDRALAENCGMIQPDLIYTGTFKHFLPHTKGQSDGLLEWQNKSRYSGPFLNGKRQGKGTFISTFSEECYEGEFKNNQRNGLGYCMFKDGT